MFCNKCGKEQAEESVFCSNCGKNIDKSSSTLSEANVVGDFFKKQAKKEVVAAGRMWKVYLKILIVFWGIIGISLIFSPGWPIGIIFVSAAGYVWKRTNAKST